MHTSTATTFLCAALLASPLAGWGQSSYLLQTFESGANSVGPANGQLLYTYAGAGGIYSGPFQPIAGTSNNALPSVESVASQGTSSFGAVNNQGGGFVASNVTFSNVSFPVTTGNYLSFKLVSYQSNNGGGMDNATTNNGFLVEVAYNGSATFVPTLRIVGQNNGAIFLYNATGVAQATVNTTTPTLTTVASVSDRNGNGQSQSIVGNSGTSNARINFGPTITQVQVRITLSAVGKTALFIDDVRIGSNGPLPVELKSFDATAQRNAVLLKWATASEKNNGAFEIQRSASGVAFETVARVAGAGNSSQGHRYEWLDMYPLPKVSYYRLRQTDYDGSESYSPVVTMHAPQELTLYPNPVRAALTVTAPTSNTHYRVLNLLGAVLLEGTVAMGSPTLDVGSLPAGLYQLEVSSTAGRTLRRFTKEL
jgi:hypothetical protein